jgi:hypothetical protein
VATDLARTTAGLGADPAGPSKGDSIDDRGRRQPSRGRSAELLIDRQLPHFEARTFSAVVVEAGTEQAYQAVRALDPDQVGRSVPFMQLMVRLRDLPARLGRRAPGPSRLIPRDWPASSTGRPSS